MTRSTSGSRCGWQMGLPPVVEGLLLDVVADGFVLYCCGDRAAPNALVASYEWDHCVDLVTIRDFARIIVARVPRKGRVDIFAPDLVHPAHPDAPTTEYPAPPSLHIPRTQQRPMTIRPPSPERAKVRSARLATEIMAHGDDPVIAACPRIAGSLSEAAPANAPGAAL
jgi:hypothetical protein